MYRVTHFHCEPDDLLACSPCRGGALLVIGRQHIVIRLDQLSRLRDYVDNCLLGLDGPDSNIEDFIERRAEERDAIEEGP